MILEIESLEKIKFYINRWSKSRVKNEFFWWRADTVTKPTQNTTFFWVIQIIRLVYEKFS